MEQSIIIAGFGGQGVISAGVILANAFMFGNKNVTWYPCYGAEMRGGAVNCEIVVSEEEVTSVHKKEADIIIALNDLAFNKFLPKLKKGGTIIANSTLVPEEKPRNDVNYIFAKISDKAREAGDVRVANMVALGILSTIYEALDLKNLNKAIERVLSVNKKGLLQLNSDALSAGCECVQVKQ